ncbi:TRAP transporter large permease [Falsiroseomonas selenitidurans]|uniref:TRAP transporter large permease protein n=1 Tax=Falsiroseomonas selenitidurans TaxID=2716335 RepID=A0ABX1E421_9PROT|nr:TRAP transporter large permease [Falsiroseomonas selenitidurans]NKC31528.1 TRAP transporter large permease [Falsiroseomonas selenitidurans]
MTLLALVFFGTMALGIPIAFTMGMAGAAVIWWEDLADLLLVPQQIFSGLDSFPLLAIPFFILAAELMTGGRITDVLLRFAGACVGRTRGGLGHANVITSTLFSGISGSALADAAGPGAVVTRMMREAGYPAGYAAALTASAAIVGPIIPPSIIMVVYALTDNSVTVSGLFMAGIVPGILISGAMMLTNHAISTRRGYAGLEARPGPAAFARITLHAAPALLMPVIIIGGIHGGVFTPTEASAVATVYALLVGRYLYRTLEWSAVPTILVRTCVMTASVMMIIGMSNIFGYVLTVLQVPQAAGEWLGSLGLSALMFLLAVNLFLLLFGIFMEPLPGVMILVPILAPMATLMGVDPLHFAIVVIVNLTLGMITPPVGGLLFVTQIVSRVPMGQIVRELWPFLGAQILVLLLLTFLPGLSTALPHALGYTH